MKMIIRFKSKEEQENAIKKLENKGYRLFYMKEDLQNGLLIYDIKYIYPSNYKLVIENGFFDDYAIDFAKIEHFTILENNI